MDEHARAVAEAVKRACIEAATAAYERAGVSGLCGEGRWEMALEAVQHLALEPVIETALHGEKPDRWP